jgi:nuclear cap-binding protein subunit 1
MLTAGFWRQQAARKAEDDVGGVAKTMTDNYEDEELRTGFTELVLQL